MLGREVRSWDTVVLVCLLVSFDGTPSAGSAFGNEGRLAHSCAGCSQRVHVTGRDSPGRLVSVITGLSTLDDLERLPPSQSRRRPLTGFDALIQRCGRPCKSTQPCRASFKSPWFCHTQERAGALSGHNLCVAVPTFWRWYTPHSIRSLQSRLRERGQLSHR